MKEGKTKEEEGSEGEERRRRGKKEREETGMSVYVLQIQD